MIDKEIRFVAVNSEGKYADFFLGLDWIDNLIDASKYRVRSILEEDLIRRNVDLNSVSIKKVEVSYKILD